MPSPASGGIPLSPNEEAALIQETTMQNRRKRMLQVRGVREQDPLSGVALVLVSCRSRLLSVTAAGAALPSRRLRSCADLGSLLTPGPRARKD